MNGWTNYETWNIALWIQNDEFLYNEARKSYSYKNFINRLKNIDIIETPDNVQFNDNEINITEIEELFNEL